MFFLFVCKRLETVQPITGKRLGSRHDTAAPPGELLPMIEVYKILTDKYDNNVNIHLERQKDSITRGHSLKLVHPRCHYDLRKYSFTVRIVNLWNS